MCAVFIPELTFTDAGRLRLVEGLNAVARHKWTAVRTIIWRPPFFADPIYRDVAYVANGTAPSFAVVIVHANFIRHVLGNTDTNLVLRSNL